MRAFTKNKIIGILVIIIVFLLVFINLVLEENNSYRKKVIFQEKIIERKNIEIAEHELIEQYMNEQFGVY